MNRINEYLIQAELAQTAYGTFENGAILVADLTDNNVDMPFDQATVFAEKWQVSDQYNDPVTGLSATVFEEIGTGIKHLAIRGTEPSANDVVSNTLLALGWPSNFNPQFLALKSHIENEWMNDPAVLQGQNFTVTGHSLGGYLAAAVKSSFPQVSDGYLFNAPGVGTILGNVADALASVLGLSSVSTNNVWNIRSSEGISFIAGLGYQLGTAVNIQTEATNSHGISTLVDALAVQVLYADLSPALTETQLNSIIDAFGSLADNTGAPITKTLESALDAIRIIALNPDNGKIVLDESQKTPAGNRDIFYTNLNDPTFKTTLSELAATGTTQLTLLSELSANDIITMAADNGTQGMAARFALTAFNPFVLEGADYTVFNSTNTLDRFHPASGTGNITDQYLIDRVSMLERKLWFNTEDKNPFNEFSNVDIHDFNIHQYLKDDIYFEDAASGYKIQQGGLFDNTPRYYFGSDAAETPDGSASKDHLYGGGGDDTLSGKEGNDYLEGGTGTDTYIINSGGGTDTVLDTDGLGVIKFGDLIAEGSSGVTDGTDWVKIGDSWVDKQNGLEYLLLPQENGSDDLLIKSSDGSGVLIKAWNDGQLGITLAENTPPDVPVYIDPPIIGDLEPVDPLEINPLGNVVVSENPAPDREDTLFGSVGNDFIQSFGGNDIVKSKEGDDRVEGGAGEDSIGGDLGNDILLGGADSDLIAGHENDDRIFADGEYTIDAAYTLGETQVGSGVRGDLLDGGLDDDLVVGEAGNDILMGGMGKDIIMGLGGNDTIEGDIDFTLADLTWAVTRSETTENNVTTYTRSYNFDTTLDTITPEAGDDDVIYSGAGNDWIFAQGGNDFVDTGTGVDVVFGGAGNDIILGQAGNDELLGDASHTQVDSSLHGDDYLVGGDGLDKLFGGGGSDYLEGGADKDILVGDGNDISVAYQGNDVLDGGAGNDELFGDGGNDTLIGGTGLDKLYGGAGNDTYIGVEEGDFIGDVEGKNTIILADTNTVAATSANEPMGISATSFAEPAAVPTNAPSSATWLVDTSVLRMTLENGTSIDLEGALYGMDAQIYYDHGTQGLDLESWVGENLHDAVTLSLGSITTASGEPVTYVYSGAGADFLFGSVNNDTIKGQAGNDQLQGDAGDDLILGGSGNDNLIGQDGNDTLQGGTGNDELQGNLGNDTLEGEDGDDNLFGQEGSDTLHGGAGNDVLLGNSEDDVYLFNLGDGQDVIWEEADSLGDVLRFGEGINPADITVAKSSFDLVLFHANGLDQVTISNWYVGSTWQLAQFEFTDGTVWSGSDMSVLGEQYLRGTAGNDFINGTALDETLSGLDGDDQLYGGGGNDILIGGKGNDFLYGGTGSNIFVFALGDGADTIDGHFPDMLRFAADISSTDIIVERMGADLLLHHQNGTDSVTIANWYSGTNDWLHQVVFDADGTTWTNSTLFQMGLNFSNQYTLGVGDGTKVIDDWGGVDSLTFGAGIDDADIAISRVGQDLSLVHVNGTDSVTIKDWFNNLAKQVEDVRFSTTGTVLTTAQLTTPFLTLTGTAGDEVINGGDAYAETLIGLGGNDTLNGGNLVDTYIFNLGDGQDTITDTSFGGNQIIFGPGLLDLANITLEPNSDSLYSFGADSVRVTAGSRITVKFIANGTEAADTINGSRFGDVIHGLGGDDVISGNEGADELYGDVGNDTLIGGDGSDWLYGGDGDDVLDGSRLTGADDVETFFSDSRDHYVGGKGNDTLHGNSRNDLYYFNLGDGNDVIIEGSYFLSGKWFFSSSDELIFGAGITPESIQFSRLNDDLLFTVSATDTVTIQNWFDSSINQVDIFRFDDGSRLTATDITRLLNTQHGTDGDDVLIGDSTDDNVLFGEAGNDTLTGGNGNDALYGGTGNDTLNGRGGNDEYYFVRGDGQDIIKDRGGFDTVFLDASISAPDLSLSRNANNLVLTLAGTSDSIAIENYMNGSLSLSINSGSNIVNYTNFYLIESYVFPDGSSLPSINSILDSFLNIRGTIADDTLNGTAWADVMYGDAGNDTLLGFEDDDVLYGGAGNDYLDGGAGSINLLYGEDGDDVLIGGGGAEFGSSSYLHGGNGNDTYIFMPNASFNILESGGSDDKIELYESVSLINLSFQKWSNDLTISVEGGGSVDLFNQLLNDTSKIERLLFADGTELGLRDIQFGTGNTLTGTAQDSILIGTGNKDTLIGGDGNDWLDGKTDGDTMTGGMGNDLYFVDNRKDVVIELSNQGIDTVFSTVTHALSYDVENLTLTGTANRIKATGNTLDNILKGNDATNTLSGKDGNDWLDGRGGKDKMLGGVGDDTYVVDITIDNIVERSGQGTDSVLSNVSFTLPKHVENLTLTGTAVINGTGNTLDNILTGNSASNILTGDKGNDTYNIGRDSGSDIVIDIDATNNNLDTAQFLTDISANQIWFQHVGNNLEASIIGTTDKLVVNDWYLGSAHHIERFKTSDGLTLLDSQVEDLVIAMAGFAPPDIGQSTLPANYAAALDPVIASLWV